MDVNSSPVNEEKNLNEEIQLNSEDALNQGEKLEVSEKEIITDVEETPEAVSESVVENKIETVVINDVETVVVDSAEISSAEGVVVPEASEQEVNETVTAKVQKSEYEELELHPNDIEEQEDDIDEHSVTDDSSVALPSIEEIVQKLRELLEQENPLRKD
ncbi:MAG: hypothetical protein PHX22_11280, partial [Dysgonamonadaceae bacterium]|nr:hypothetical protein [Dysgonamonadaceae bacterium]